MALNFFLRYLLLNQIILVILNFYSYSYATITIGNFPTCERLNHEHYLIISAKNILIADSTFTSIMYIADFEYDIYSAISHAYSTTIAQFPKEYNGYIISIIKTDLYVFDKNGNIQNKVENVNFLVEDKIYSIIPFWKSDNYYYFYIIYGNPPDGESNANKYVSLIFIKCTYNNALNTISFE